MENTYLVEIRLARTKWRIRKVTDGIDRRFGLGDSLELHPHMTLFGPFLLPEGGTSHQILELIGGIASRYDPVSFFLDGWERRDGMHGSVIAFPVRPSASLCNLVQELAGALGPMTISQNAWDQDPKKKWFHVTVANRLGADRASAIYAEVTGNPLPRPLPPEGAGRRQTGLLARFFTPAPVPEQCPAPVPPVLIDEDGFRITVMRDNAILAEYDLVEKRWIFSDHSHSSARWQKALQLFRGHAGLELQDPVPPRPDDIFLTADLHLGHANIIRYCSRPFLWSDVQEMDHVLIKNWNYTVGRESRVYCLGDLRYGRDAAPASSYRKRLRGQVTLIAGNHDEPDNDVTPSVRLRCGEEEFFLVHDPVDSPAGFDGWVVHGHHHNNDLRNFPFINFRQRRINVSVEVTGYMPVGMREIQQTIRERKAAGDTTPILVRSPSGIR